MRSAKQGIRTGTEYISESEAREATTGTCRSTEAQTQRSGGLNSGPRNIITQRTEPARAWCIVRVHAALRKTVADPNVAPSAAGGSNLGVRSCP